MSAKKGHASFQPRLEQLEGRDQPSAAWIDAVPTTPDVVDVFYDYRSENGYANRITVTQRQLAERAMVFWEEASFGRLRFIRNTSAPASKILNIGTGNLAAVGYVSGTGGTLGAGGHETSASPGVAWMDFREVWDLQVGNGNPIGTFDYYTVTAHEIGHGLGLDHLYDGTGSDIMAANYSQEKTTLTPRDRSAIWSAYGQGVGTYTRFETRDSSGNVYTLRDDGWLLVNGRPSWARIRDFALDTQGRLVVLNSSGLLQRQLPGRWETLGTNIVKFAVRYDGVTYALRSDGWLLRDNSPSWANTADFALDTQGRLVILNRSGLLQRQLPGGVGWETLGTSIVKFAVRNDSAVFALRSDGWLLVNNSPSWANTGDFALDNRGLLVILNRSGLLERQLPGGVGWETLGTNIVKFAVRNGAAVLALRSDGWLLVDGQPTWSNTLDFALTRGGRLYWLSTGGLLQRQTPTGWVDLRSGVASMWLDSEEVLQITIRAVRGPL